MDDDPRMFRICIFSGCLLTYFEIILKINYGILMKSLLISGKTLYYNSEIVMKCSLLIATLGTTTLLLSRM
jgi:hypothetical protein